MAEIIYFGTKGCSGHCPIGIDKMLTQVTNCQAWQHWHDTYHCL